MRTKDLEVRQQLIDAGYDVRAVKCRGDLYEALAQILTEDPTGNDEFVDRLRTILSTAGRLERQAEIERARTEHQGIKACPECHLKPDIDCVTSSTDEVFVSCMNHDGHVVFMGGATLSAAIGNWNSDDWVSPPIERVLFPL